MDVTDKCTVVPSLCRRDRSSDGANTCRTLVAARPADGAQGRQYLSGASQWLLLGWLAVLPIEPGKKVFARLDDQMTFQLGVRIATQLITQQGKLPGFLGVKRHPKLERGDGHLL